MNLNVIFEWLGYIFGYIIHFAYILFKNYGIAIIFFTVVSTILRFPLNIYQQRQMANQARIQPKLKEIQEKYKNDKTAQSQAMQEIYQKEGVSQTAGCLPMLIQFPLLFGLLQAIYKPFSCVMHLSKDLVVRLAAVLNITNMTRDELGLVNAVRNLANSDSGSIIVNRMGNLIHLPAAPIESEIGSQGSIIAQNAALSVLDGYKTITVDQISGILGDRTDEVMEMTRSFKFFGMDLLSRPEFWNAAIVLSFLTFIFAAGGMILSNKINKAAMPQSPGCNQNVMAIAMGGMSFFFSLQWPAAMSLYWGANSAFSPLQTWVTKKYFGTEQMNAQSEARRLARIKLEEKAVYDEITSEKGKINLKPDPLPEFQEKSNYSGNNKRKKK